MRGTEISRKKDGVKDTERKLSSKILEKNT